MSMSEKTGKVTQREIARIAGVSQTTVSMVLNDRDDTNVRIPESTRERVKRAIEQTTYVADPAARRLAGLDNKILGVFTYEAALTPESMDFYGPLLNGIERAAEQLDCDLLFFTSSPVENGSRRLFHKNTRLRLADGCILLGQHMDGDELARLVREGFPFVAVGRRDEAEGVPYVGIDYRSLTRGLIERAVELGHTKAVYVHRGKNTPSARDRRAEIDAANESGVLSFTSLPYNGYELSSTARAIVASGATVVFVEDAFAAEDIELSLDRIGVSVPDQLSLTALGEVQSHTIKGRTLSGFHTPRQRIASEALALLKQLITAQPEELGAIDTQRLLDGSVELGETLVARRGDK
jgi:DNA-binding LacI/PurR family transcriptional regulator